MHNAQCLAGMAFSNALLGIVHSMAHKTGAAFEGGHIIHGAANAMYLPKVIKYNSKDATAAARYAYIADFLGLGGNTTEEKIDNLIEMLRKMNDELNIPQKMVLLQKTNSLKNFTILQLMLFLMPVQVLILVSLVRKRWRNFSSAATMIQKLIFKLSINIIKTAGCVKTTGSFLYNRKRCGDYFSYEYCIIFILT